MKNRIIYLLAVVIFGCGFVQSPDIPAQQPPPPPDMAVDAATRSSVIEIMLKELNETYVFPETAKNKGAPSGRECRPGSTIR